MKPDLEAFENNVVDALLQAAAYRTETVQREIHVVRNEVELFKFKIHPLTEDDLSKCRRQNTKNRGRRDEETNWSRYASQAIYEATDADDKKRLWQNPEVREKLNLASGVDVIQAVLTPAERAKIFETIESISGYDNEDLDGLIQNL